MATLGNHAVLHGRFRIRVRFTGCIGIRHDFELAAETFAVEGHGGAAVAVEVQVRSCAFHDVRRGVVFAWFRRLSDRRG